MLAKDIATVLTLFPTVTYDVTKLVKDEHARFQLYVEALTLATPATVPKLITMMMRDPDQVMIRAALVAYVDRKASLFSSQAAFSAWAAPVLELLRDHVFVARRVEEWKLFRSIVDGEFQATGSLCDASDWLQRKVAQEAESQEVLKLLERQGRTKRVRNIARSRARHIK